MPTREELEQAINNLEEQETSFDVCLKLDVYYSLLDRYYGKAAKHTNYSSESDFMQAAAEADQDTLLATIDELMDCLKLINPKLHESVLLKLRG